jgi:hypothetical protein
MRSPSSIVCLAFLLLTGCSTARFDVRDQGTGVPMVQARAVVIVHGREEEADTADASGRLKVSLPDTPDAVIAVRAQGFVQWSKTVAWIRTQPQPLAIELEPVWMSDFLKTGLKPSQIVEPKGCNCHPKAR